MKEDDPNKIVEEKKQEPESVSICLEEQNRLLLQKLILLIKNVNSFENNETNYNEILLNMFNVVQEFQTNNQKPGHKKSFEISQNTDFLQEMQKQKIGKDEVIVQNLKKKLQESEDNSLKVGSFLKCFLTLRLNHLIRNLFRSLIE
jgi:hypothetical protein